MSIVNHQNDEKGVITHVSRTLGFSVFWIWDNSSLIAAGSYKGLVHDGWDWEALKNFEQAH